MVVERSVPQLVGHDGRFPNSIRRPRLRFGTNRGCPGVVAAEPIDTGAKTPAMERWCGREDSNFHPVSGTAPSTLRVYQFRHDRMPAKALQTYRRMPREIANDAAGFKGCERASPAARSSGGSATGRLPIPMRWPPWRRGSRRSVPAVRRNCAGCSSIRRCTPPAPARAPRTCSRRRASRCSAPAAAASTPITAPASGSPTSCSTCSAVGRTSGRTSGGSRTG